MTEAQFKQMFPNASPATIEANRYLWDPKGDPMRPAPLSTAREMMAVNRHLEIRPTSDEAKLNKLEKAYRVYLIGLQPQWFGVQCITLKLGHDCRYTPDFWALDEQGLRAIDTKGKHVWEDSIIKMRVAARMFPFIRFLKVLRDGEVWNHVEIKP